MTQDEMKRAAADAALAHIEPLLNPDSVVGVGTGSTANHFVDALIRVRHKFDAAVASSEATRARLSAGGIHVIDLNAARSLLVYAFASDVVARIKVDALRTGLGRYLRERLPNAADIEEAVV